MQYIINRHGQSSGNVCFYHQMEMGEHAASPRLRQCSVVLHFERIKGSSLSF